MNRESEHADLLYHDWQEEKRRHAALRVKVTEIRDEMQIHADKDLAILTPRERGYRDSCIIHGKYLTAILSDTPEGDTDLWITVDKEYYNSLLSASLPPGINPAKVRELRDKYAAGSRIAEEELNTLCAKVTEMRDVMNDYWQKGGKSEDEVNRILECWSKRLTAAVRRARCVAGDSVNVKDVTPPPLGIDPRKVWDILSAPRKFKGSDYNATHILSELVKELESLIDAAETCNGTGYVQHEQDRFINPDDALDEQSYTYPVPCPDCATDAPEQPDITPPPEEVDRLEANKDAPEHEPTTTRQSFDDALLDIARSAKIGPDPSWPTALHKECGNYGQMVAGKDDPLMFYASGCLRTGCQLYSGDDPACPAFCRRPQAQEQADADKDGE